MSIHPLMEIRFEQELYGDPNTTVEVIVFWYHTPKVGDLIALPSVQGRVKTVTWCLDYIIVRLHGKAAS